MKNIYVWTVIILLSVCIEVDAAPLDRIIDSANADNVHAQKQLGVIYALGKNTRIDIVKAKKWLLKAAKEGSVKAEYNLGVIYSDS